MKKILLVAVFFHFMLCAADVTGTWSGSLKGKRPDGADQTDSAYLVLKQQGDAVTGTAGGTATDQRPIEKGKLDGDQLTFEISANSGSFKIALKLQPDGNTMIGSIQREQK